MNPFTDDTLRALACQHGTPLWVYDAATIRQRIAELRVFDTIRFAQKACSNTHLLKLLREAVFRDAYFKSTPQTEIRVAKMGNNAGIVGAAMLGI